MNNTNALKGTFQYCGTNVGLSLSNLNKLLKKISYAVYPTKCKTL